MSFDKYRINPEFIEIMPQEIIDLEEKATWSTKSDKPRGIKELPETKEILEEHSLCAGCPEAMALRYVLSALPKPEDTIIVNSTGCTSLMFPHIALHTVHSLFGNQNAVASGIKRVLDWRFPDAEKDVVVLAGDGATVDIGLDYTLQSFFRQENITTICFDNEVYANTGGQESGATAKGQVFKMAPTGKKFDKVPMWELATTSGCHYSINMTASAPKAVARAVREAILVAREIGPTFINIYTPCILEIGLSANEGLGEMKDQDKDRFASYKHVSPEAEAFLAKCKEEGRL
ncbi:MAG: thiamine pyrophosphate-dependent enzyme [Campylobacterota bacterium]|nr:thiamine pyrophosphate-dependent enzyme [Campylobacterota bacterium]